MKIHIHLHDSTPPGTQWITLENGQHVLIDSKTGEVKDGAGGAMNGKKYASAETVPFEQPVTRVRGVELGSLKTGDSTPEADSACDAIYAEITKEMSTVIGAMTPEQRDACNIYFGVKNRRINGALRGTRVMDSETRSQVDAILSVIDKMGLERDTKVYRGMSSDTASAGDITVGIR